VSLAKTAELIEMPFGGRGLSRVGSKNHVLHWVEIPPRERGNVQSNEKQ